MSQRRSNVGRHGTLPNRRFSARIGNSRPTGPSPIGMPTSVTQMGGQGNFSDPRLGIDVKHSPDMVTSKLPALRAYQHSLPAPPPPAGRLRCRHR